MANKKYVTLPRLPRDTDWSASSHPEQERAMIEGAIVDAAEQAGLFLYNRKPEAGWESKVHTRDGKYWPCGEQTQGARPVWIWAAL